jgi:threonyl-tRNA synthetase
LENEALRLLLIHADKFEYETKEKAVKEPEPLSDRGKKGNLQDGLVVFSTVEKSDEEAPEATVANAQIR